jgi:hypothetical protein
MERRVTNWIIAAEAAYFDALWRRRGEAKRIVYREVTFVNGDRPARHDCHANAARWAAQTPDVVPVHGWLIEAGDEHAFRLAAHSLLEHCATGLFDITPLDPFQPAFLRHEGSAENFFALLPRFNTQLWPLPGSAKDQ